MKRLMMLLAMLAVVVMVAAAPALAQEKGKDKGKNKDKEGKKEKMEMPKTGGLPVDPTVAGLGAGALLVGGGLVVRRVTKR